MNPYSVDHSEINISNLIPTNYGYAGTDDKKLLSDMFQCFSVNGMNFNPASITGDVTVECNTEHTGMEDSICDKCGYKLVIDLGELDKYISGELQTHGYITVMDTIGDEGRYTKLTINTSGTYKLTGANTTDVKIYAASGVTANIVCDNAYIRNRNGDFSYGMGGGEDSVLLHSYTYPFGTDEGGRINLSGKLVVDTYTADLDIAYQSTNLTDIYSNISADHTIVSYTTGNTSDEAFYLNGAEYDASDYAGENLCIKVEGKPVGEYTFTAGTDNVSISYYDDHSFVDDSDTCEHCGVEFTRYNVTFEDGSESPATERVIEGRAVARPWSDPTAPVGKQFCGWYADEECSTAYNFDLPVTEDITLYAGWEALPVQSIAVKTAPTNTSYIEGQKFDPAGLEIAVTYENGTLEVAYNDDTKADFSFEPALTEELALTNEKVTITYGGKSADQDITVVEKQLSSIAVKTEPKKTTYIEGQKFDPTGLVITLNYDNGKTEDVAYSDSTKDGFTFAPEVLSLNNAKVTITYGGKSTQQAVTVTSKSLTSIAVKTEPKKTTYIEGEKFDPTGLVITLNYDNGKSEDIAYSDSTKNGFTFAPEELSLNNAKVTITYGGKTTQQAVTVTSKSLTSIAVKTEPKKTTYIEGQKFDPTGLVITLTYDNGKTEDVAYSDSTKGGFTFAPEELSLNNAKVTITYGGKTTQQAVTVTSKALSSIAVKTAPTKTTYIEGEAFDPTGLVITLTYDNGKTEDVAYSDETKDGFTFAPEELSLSNAKVTITYGGKSTQQAVTVTSKALSSIAVKTAPKKTTYIEGQKFDPTGLVITLTYDNGKTEDVAYSDSTKNGFTFAPETLTTGDKTVTITYGGKSAQQAVKVSSKSSGGSSGGGSYRPTTPTDPNPSIGGSAKSWSDVAADLGKLTNGSEATIELNGNTTVPVEVIKVISKKKIKATLVVNSVKSWKTDGADITAPAAADLTILTTAKLKIDDLRGKQGTQFTMNNTNIPTDLKLSFVSGNEGKFANLYKSVDGKLTFVTCAKIGTDGSVVLPDIAVKGDYVAMLFEFSDRPGDMNNDGVMSGADSSDILKQVIGAANGANSAVSDMNGDGKVTAADAAEILKKLVGLA